jgi:hypothetical protein
VTQVTVLHCTPLDPVNAELAERAGTLAPHTLRQTFVDGGVDVVAGDVLVVEGAEYPVRSAAVWTWRNTSYKHLVVEVLRR